jgi:hypothetical protein
MHAEQRLRDLYQAFNERDIDTVLAALAPDVDWPNGMDGGREIGHEAVRAYWTRQWGVINPRVDPVSVIEFPDGSFDIEVHQVVRDLSGTIVNDRTVHHVYRFDRGLVTRMDIVEG